jgi:alpha-L-rhamnosidase
MPQSAALQVQGLRTECLDNPLGVELQRPRLSWRLESERLGARQTAYHLRVATSLETLERGGADLWDSGKFSSAQCFDVPFDGPPLTSRQRCWWTVQVWDDAGAEARATPAWWEMGLLAPGDWTAEWLAVETDDDRADRNSGLDWIWRGDRAEAEPRRFRRRFHLAEGATEATLFIVARGRLNALHLDGAPIDLPTPNPHAFGRDGMLRLDLGALARGEHVLAAEVVSNRRPRDPPWRGGLAAMLKLKAGDGAIEPIVSGADWKTSLGDNADWTSPGCDDSAWDHAEPAGGARNLAWPPTAAMRLRTAFAVERPPVAARLRVTALGAYEAFLNGEGIGDALLAPESTDFRKRALYQTHDVTDQIVSGDNVLGAHVGDGWYASVVAPGGRYAFGPPPRRVLAQLELTFADGARQVVATGPGWRIGPSPVTE